MRRNTRISAVLVAVSLIASACGGGADVDTDQTALLEELEAQVEELTAEAEAREQAAAELTPDPAPTTTEVVIEDAASAEETSAPELAEEAPSDQAEEEAVAAAEEPTAEAADETPPAPVSGDVINSSMGPDEVAALIVSTIGPTDNLSGQVQRVDLDFPTISTLPDTQIVRVRVDYRFNRYDEEWEKNTSVELVTSAAPADATLAYQTEFAALFPDERVRTETQQSGDTVFNIASVGPIDVVSQSIDEGTFVEVEFWGQVASDAVIESLSGLEQFSAGSEVGQFRNALLDFSFGAPMVRLQSLLLGPDAADIEARADAIAVASGFTFAQENLGSREYAFDGIAGFAQIRGSDFNESLDGEARGLMWTEYRY